MQWYYSKNGNQLGPISAEEIKAKLAAGEIAATDLVWKDGMGDWIPAAQVGELRSAVAPVSTASPAPTGAAASPYSPPSSVPSYGQSYTGGEIPNYLWQSIVVTILCCWPLGIPAIVFAAKVDGLKARGDIAGATDASKKAKMWSWISVGGWVVVVVIYAIIIGVSAASGNLK